MHTLKIAVCEDTPTGCRWTCWSRPSTASIFYCHKSHLVNLAHVESLDRDLNVFSMDNEKKSASAERA